ncbi:unnamed protein product [Rotaria magnacalcarata]|uniref:protein-tyrosine-phosphatase n=2 Tax=Rotaria magnacalcarata TaxID=392030 RepID=A0A816G511_9BILA|nr:unnamed protein product [Rotaria magnacalcarata]CAF1489228.1 unnamed protein product [Rotaria magnacalcarata]CAF1669348.1 unnamed protein product [Rotaria magnacalcarata]CAF1669353.1 unnamed protein product [Rotaria magnacalcarata]CAF2066658.1 unnamed protein product [Rotaria magnacalcarata]
MKYDLSSMIPEKLSIEKKLFNWQDQQQPKSNIKHPADSAFSSTRNIIVLSIGTILLSAIIAFLAVLYWRLKQRRSLNSKCEPSESTPFSSISIEPTRPKEIILYPRVSKLVDFNLSDINENAYSKNNTTNKNPAGNLLKRRGNVTPLTISVTPKIRPLNSPTTDCSPDEYLQTASRKLTIDELCQHAKDTYSLYQEFWATPTNHTEKIGIYGSGTKNRYCTIIANEHSRVKLPELVDDPVSSYINANYISGWPNESRAFIATQGPLSNTIIDFYRLIWQEYVPVIVMITRLVEKNKSKCERYIPDSQTNQYGPFCVEVQSIIYQNDYEIRRLTIEFEDEQRQIDHYWYTAWPDQSCPNVVQPLIDLVHNVERDRVELSNINKKSGPVVVHCSAGIGRTGCFIALSNGIRQLRKERAVDVLRILCNLRRDRGGMIQTNDQYHFVYLTLSEYARTLE